MYHKIQIWYGDCATIKICVAAKSYIRGIDIRVKNGVILTIFCRLTHKGSSVVHSQYNISHIVW